MPSLFQGTNADQGIMAVDAAAVSNQSGTYYNGPTNSGVGATFTYASGATTIDGVALTADMRVLLQAQTLGYQNGIYVVSTAGATGVATVLTRAPDFQCIEHVCPGYYVPVSAGTVQGGAIYTVIKPAPAAIGVPGTSGLNDIKFRGVVPV